MKKAQWWQTGIIYQIYPRSFFDSNADGIGDLAGITQKLDYLRWLGIDAIWLSPFFPSPMADFGYDVSNYTDVDPIFGTLKDFDGLVSAAHNKGIKVVIDFVPNHSSDRHPWFQASRSSRDNPKRDWYLWRESARNGKLPNNWLSIFGGPAWTWDELTRQYFGHSFLKEQPDLNWRNPEVAAAMHEVLRFWLDRGVDGFRVDAIASVIKDMDYRNNPRNPHYKTGLPPYEKLLPIYSTDRPEVHRIIAGLRKVSDAYKERVLIGEAYLPVDRLMAYYGVRGRGFHMPFNFQLIRLPWKPEVIGRAVEHYEKSLPAFAWPNWVLGNHDQSRIASRVGEAQARTAAMLLLTLRGTPTMYYGDEIGMQDVPIPRHKLQDPVGKSFPHLKIGRDPERTPMQWNSSHAAGFTSSHPWLRVSRSYKKLNVESEQQQPQSILHLYRRLIELRRLHPALHLGACVNIERRANVVSYTRSSGKERFLIVLNLGRTPARFDLSSSGRILLSTHMDREGESVSHRLHLRSNEGLIINFS